jgi:hypothetical protein
LFRDDEHALGLRIESLRAEIASEESRTAEAERERRALRAEALRLRHELRALGPGAGAWRGSRVVKVLVIGILLLTVVGFWVALALW